MRPEYFLTRTVQLVILSIISAFLVWQFAEPLVRFFGLKNQALILSSDYLKAIAPFMWPLVVEWV